MIPVIITLVLSILIVTYSICKDKFSFINIKLVNVEEKINSILIKRKDLIQDSEKIIKKTLNTTKNIYESLNDIDEVTKDMIVFNKKLEVCVNEIHLINDKYKKLQNNDEFQKILFTLDDTTNHLEAYKNYYNDSAESYNKLLGTFPINFIAFLKRKKKKSLFPNKPNNN